MSLPRLLPITVLTLALTSCGRSASQLPKDADADAQRTGGTAKTAGDRDADKGKDEKAEAIELSADSQRRLGIIVEPVAEAALAVPLSVVRQRLLGAAPRRAAPAPAGHRRRAGPRHAA